MTESESKDPFPSSKRRVWQRFLNVRETGFISLGRRGRMGSNKGLG